MQKVTVPLRISARRFQAYYEGTAEFVVAQADDGRTVQFPARVLRPFLTYRGIEGTFEITFTSQQKFLSIKQVHGENGPGSP